MEDDEDSDFDIDEMDAMLASDEDAEESDEEANGGPSDPTKSKKARKAAAVKQLKKELAEDMEVDLSDSVEPLAPQTRPGERLEYSRILPILVGLLTLGWLVQQLATLPFLTVISSLNGYLMVFLILGLVLHGTPRGFLNAVTKAVPTTAGVLVQFPLYAAMAAVLTRDPVNHGESPGQRVAQRS